MPLSRPLLVGFCLALACAHGWAVAGPAASTELSGSYYSDAERGWVWYETPPPPEKPVEKLPQPPAAITIAPAVSAPLSSAWIRDNLDSYRDLAIDVPSEQNVALYLYLQRAAMDKAERFATVAQRVTMKYPGLDENQRSPQTTVAKVAAQQQRSAAETAALGRVASQAGIWYFFRSDCPYCHAQSPILEAIQRRHGFHVLPISLDGLPMPDGRYPDFRADQGQGARLSVTVTPTLFLVTSAGKVLPLAEGLQTLPELERHLFASARDANLITEAEYAAAQFGTKTNLLDGLPPDISEAVTNDPARFTELLRAAAMEGGGTPIATGTPARPQPTETQQ